MRRVWHCEPKSGSQKKRVAATVIWAQVPRRHSGFLERHLDRTCCCLCKCVAESLRLLAKRIELHLHKFGLNSNDVLQLLGLAQFAYVFLRSSGVFLGVVFQQFTKLCPTRQIDKNVSCIKLK